MYAGVEKVVVNVGIPFDMQGDDFYVSKWGFTTLPAGMIYDPEWVTFNNVTITVGIKFIISAPIEAIG